MRSLLIIGGMTGFLLGLVLGLAQGSPWPVILWRSSVGAVVGGLLLKWWGGIWMKSWVEAQRERQDALVNKQSRAASPSVASQPRE